MIALLEMQSATANCSMTSLNIPSAVPETRSAPPVSASWLSELSRIGWAWEFLRRNGDYRRQYLEQADPAVLEGWGLQYFEDPDLDSRHAQVFWRPDVCSAVLPVTATTLTQTTKKRRVSTALPGPMRLFHQPGLRSLGECQPAQ